MSLTAVPRPASQSSASTGLPPDPSTARLLRLVGTFLPVAYIWSLPLLASLGFAHYCENWPKCMRSGASVSDFIANT